MSTFLVWGANGWIGSKVCNLLKEAGDIVIPATSRLQNFSDIVQELRKVKPNYVLHLAGITGKPNVDWCESHKSQTYQINTIGHTNLARACYQEKIHITYYGTGCLYTYDDEHPIGSTFTETDLHNFFGSTYSISKGIAEDIMAQYDNILILRLRMPISDDLAPKNLISKLITYKKVINIPNSMSILSELLPISIDMSKKKVTGIYNFTNPGAISHNEILQLYKKYIQPDFTWENFSLQEQDAILASKRSNCQLDTSKLQKEYSVTEIHVAMDLTMQKLVR